MIRVKITNAREGVRVRLSCDISWRALAVPMIWAGKVFLLLSNILDFFE